MAAPPAEPLTVAASVRVIRLRHGWSQRELAARIGVPRTYVSKTECQKALPTVRTLERLARALEVTVAELVGGVEQTRANKIKDLVADPFVAQIVPFLPRLSQLQMDGVLVQVREMTARRRMA